MAAIKSLESLTLDSTRVGNDGIARLVALPNLRRRSIRGTEVSNRAVESLVKMKALRSLDPIDTRINAEGHENLRAANPKFSIAIDAPP